MKLRLRSRTKFERTLFIGILVIALTVATVSMLSLLMTRQKFQDLFLRLWESSGANVIRDDLAFFARQRLEDLAKVQAEAVGSSASGCESTRPEAALDCIVAGLVDGGGMPEGLTLDYVVLYRRSDDGWAVLGRHDVAGGEAAPLSEHPGSLSPDDIEQYQRERIQPTQRNVGHIVSLTSWGQNYLLTVSASTDSVLSERWRRSRTNVDRPAFTVFFSELIWRQGVWLLLTLAAIALLAVVVSRIVSARVSRPLANLVGTMERVSAGDLSCRAESSSQEEFSLLVASFNSMVTNIEQAAEHRQKVSQELLRDAIKRLDGPLLGESSAVRDLRKAVATHAATDKTVLLIGAPGTGKEAVARAIHSESERTEGAFIYVNCAQLTSENGGSFLGTARGYLEEQARPTPGRFDLADGGTLYLDGIDHLVTAAQSEVLTVLSAFDALRSTGEQPHPDVRVIATSTRGSDAPLSGRLDQELYRHLRRRRLTLPTLVERVEDLPDLVEHFVTLYARRIGKPVQRISEESMEKLKAYEWPGNIQELSNVIEQAVLTARGPVAEINEAALDEGTPLGSYRLIERLGAGGMGEVWRAKHRLLARLAAVKLIRASALEHAGDDHRLLERFQREAVATANLRSPHTVQLFDFGISATGSFYYVMELLEGMDLQTMVKRFGPLPSERVVSFLRQACRSLIEAHDAGLVHRDIKPANLYVCRLGPEVDFLKVLDFGMVKAMAAGDQTQLTTEGTAQGTPAFMSPEMALGESEADGRVDIYSLGCVAYWLLTGSLVFEANSVSQMMMDHIQTPPVPPSQRAEQEIPESLERIVLSCLEKSKEERPPTALILWESLGSVEFRSPWTQERAEHWWMVHRG